MKGLSFFLMFIIVTFSFFSIAETKVYKWVDADGKTHFSDNAKPGTPTLTVTTTNLFSSDDVFPDRKEMLVKKAASENKTKKGDKTPIIYEVSITSPKNDTSLHTNDGLVVVQVSTTPKLESDHKLQLYVDGKKQGKPQNSTTLRVQNMDRGTHKLQVHLVDNKGVTTAETKMISIHLLRATVKKQVPVVLPQ